MLFIAALEKNMIVAIELYSFFKPLYSFLNFISFIQRAYGFFLAHYFDNYENNKSLKV